MGEAWEGPGEGVAEFGQVKQGRNKHQGPEVNRSEGGK